MTAEQLTAFLAQNGWPTVMLIATALGLRKIALWFEPRAAKLIDQHVETMEALRNSSAKQTDILDGLNQQFSENTALIKEIHKATIPRVNVTQNQ